MIGTIIMERKGEGVIVMLAVEGSVIGMMSRMRGSAVREDGGWRILLRDVEMVMAVAQGLAIGIMNKENQGVGAQTLKEGDREWILRRGVGTVTMNRANQNVGAQTLKEEGRQRILLRDVVTVMVTAEAPVIGIMNKQNRGAVEQTLKEDGREGTLHRGVGTAMMNKENRGAVEQTVKGDDREWTLHLDVVTVMPTAGALVTAIMNKQNQGEVGQILSEDVREGTRLQRLAITGRERSSEEVERDAKNVTAREIKGKKTRIASAAKRRMRHRNRKLNSRISTLYLHKCLVIWLFCGCAEYVKGIMPLDARDRVFLCSRNSNCKDMFTFHFSSCIFLASPNPCWLLS